MDEDTAKAARYRQRAKEVGTIAEGMTDPQSRQSLLVVASDYLDMAATMDRIASMHRAMRR
jgi:hypothetical protein